MTTHFPVVYLEQAAILGTPFLRFALSDLSSMSQGNAGITFNIVYALTTPIQGACSITATTYAKLLLTYELPVNLQDNL